MARTPTRIITAVYAAIMSLPQPFFTCVSNICPMSTHSQQTTATPRQSQNCHAQGSSDARPPAGSLSLLTATTGWVSVAAIAEVQ